MSQDTPTPVTLTADEYNRLQQTIAKLEKDRTDFQCKYLEEMQLNTQAVKARHDHLHPPTMEPSSTLSTSFVRARAPQPFSGKPTDHVDVFLTRIENYLSTGNIPQDNWIQLAATYLIDAAETWFIGKNRKPDEFLDWKSFHTKLSHRFMPLNEFIAAKTHYRHCTQCTSVAAYIRDFDAAVSRLVEQPDDITLRDDFYIGLKPHVQALLNNNIEYDTYEELAAAAKIKDEAYFKAGMAPKYAHLQSQAPSSPILPIAATHSTPRLPKLTPEHKEQLRKTNGCFFCQKDHAGHRIADCPLRKTMGNPSKNIQLSRV